MRTMRMLVVIAMLCALAACSFKILRPVDDTESSWRQVETPAASAPAPTGAPVGVDHGY